MTLFRSMLLGFGLLLLCLLGVAVYCYQNLPSLLSQQARLYLQEYGVQDIRFEQLQISSNGVDIDQLWLRGESDGLMFEATASSVDIGYDWRMLLNGRLSQVTLDELDLELEQMGSSEQPVPTRISVEDLLPQPVMTKLPLDSLEIEQWSLAYRAPGVSPLSVQGNLQLAEQLTLHFETVLLASPAVVDIWTGDKGASLDAQFVFGDEETPSANFQVGLARVSGDRWQWDLQGELNYAEVLAWLRRLELDPAVAVEIPELEGVEILGNSEIAVQVSHPDTVDLSTAAGRSILEQPALSQVRADIRLSNNIDRLDYPSVVEGVVGLLEVSLALDNGQVEVTVEPGELAGKLWIGQLSLPPDTQHWLHWKEAVPVRWRHEAPISIASTVEEGWLLRLRDASLLLGSKGSELKWGSLNIDTLFYPGEQARMKMQLEASINTRLNKQQLPQLELALQHEGSFAESEIQLALADTAESMSLDAQATMNLDDGSGNYGLSVRSLDLPYAASTVLPLLKKFKLLQQSIEISGGSILFASELKGETFDIASLQQNSQLVIQDLSGIYEEYQFGGMALKAAWSGIEQWKTRGSIDFSLARLNVGFDLLDIHAQLRLPKATPIAQPVVSIEKLSAGMFGGRVYLPEPARWDFGGDTNRLTLRAEQWQLAELVALQQDQDIRALGVLEGELPVTVSGGRVIIEKGYLRALAPGGSIQYVANEASQALAASSPELGLALDLLSDFQYQVLSSEVGLDKEGNLLLGLSLSGKNPTQYEGRPINFNINLEQNLDPLLQSLRLSDKLVEQIEGRLQ